MSLWVVIPCEFLDTPSSSQSFVKSDSCAKYVLKGCFFIFSNVQIHKERGLSSQLNAYTEGDKKHFHHFWNIRVTLFTHEN